MDNNNSYTKRMLAVTDMNRHKKSQESVHVCD